MRFRPYPVLTLFALASLAVLIMLGNWQYGRYAEKIGREETPERAPEIVSVSVETRTGRPAQNVYGAADSEPLWRRYVPGRINGVGEPVLIMWDAIGGPEPVALSVAGLGTVERESRVFVRTDQRPRFGQRNKPEENLWYAFDGPEILSAFGYEADTVRVVEPVQMTVRNGADVSQTRQTANPYASPKPIDPLPPQRHLGYALTWWGLAAALIGVYFALHAARGRLRLRAKT